VLGFALDGKWNSPSVFGIHGWTKWNGGSIRELPRFELPGSLKTHILQVLEIAQGLEYLHSLRVVHGDLRCVRIIRVHPHRIPCSYRGLWVDLYLADYRVAFQGF
jgi:hypothetical protein